MRLPLIKQAEVSPEQRPIYDDMRAGIEKSFRGFKSIADNGRAAGALESMVARTEVRKADLGADQGGAGFPTTSSRPSWPASVRPTSRATRQSPMTSPLRWSSMACCRPTPQSFLIVHKYSVRSSVSFTVLNLLTLRASALDRDAHSDDGLDS
jgi:hypothetical protein